jgi:hypothetical protein
MFWSAWKHTFTKALVEQAFAATGIYPPNADIILNRFKKPPPSPPNTPTETSELKPAPGSPNYLKFATLINRAVRDQD